MRIQAVFEKNERIRHIGHLDIQRAVQRGLRRSGLPVAYSNGFNPHILVSFASALSTGACGLREIMDVTMAEKTEPEEFLAKMNRSMPPEMRLLEARAVEDRHPALTALLKAASYELVLRDAAQAEKLTAVIGATLAQERIPAVRKSKSGLKECDIKPWIYALRGKDTRLFATLALTERETCKPGMLVDALKAAAGMPAEEEVRMLVIRTGLLGEDQEGRFVPLETL